MPHSLAGGLSALICLTVCVYALIAGRTPERVAAVAQGGCTLGIVLFQDRVQWMDPEHRIMAFDATLLMVLVALTSATRRRWLIGATAAQLLSVTLHFIVFRSRLIGPRAYFTADNALGYVVSFSLAVGVWQVARDRGRRRTPSSKLLAEDLDPTPLCRRL